MPSPVDRYFREVKKNNPDYTDDQAWATAWSIFCKHKDPGSEHCHKDPSGYLEGKSATMAVRVAMRYEQKESKEHRIRRIAKMIRGATGLPKGLSEAIAEALVRRREIARLAIQKNWPINGDFIEGPTGKLSIKKIEPNLEQVL